MDDSFKCRRLVFNSNLITNNDLCTQYDQLRTDEERFLFVLQIIGRHLGNFLNSECDQKDSERAIRLRENGNKSFIGSQYYKAVQEYTESIVYAVNSSEELAVVYANRSAVLFKLKKYADCLADIGRALNLKYPDRLKAKLYKRKGLCLTTLGRPGAESSFQEALVWLDKMGLSKDKMDESKNELRKLSSAPYTFAKPAPADVMQPPLPQFNPPNSEIPCASAAVAIRYTKQFGRHIVATRKIKPGEILVVEKPYCMGLNPKHMFTHCSYCLQVSWALIPCKFCVNVTYCSEACRDGAWNQYHEIECSVLGFMRNFEFNEMLEVSLRVVIIATDKGRTINSLKQEVINVDRNKDPRTKGFCDDGKFHSDQYRSIYSLPDNVDKKSVVHILSRAFWVALTVCVLARESNMFGKKLATDSLAENLDVIFVGGLLLKHLQICCVTMHSFGAARSLTEREHGHALMALCSLFNHSCDPNVLRQWYAGRMILFALYPIEQGEQIFETYGPRFIDMSLKERKKILENWNFNCECISCTNDWPILLNLPNYKAQSLTQGQQNKIYEAMALLYRHSQGLEKASTIENVLNMLDQLTKCIEILFNLVQRPCKQFYELINMLTEYYQSANIVFDYELVSPTVKNKLHSVFYLSLQHKFSQK